MHSFTSPLGTLIPALIAYLTGAVSDDLVLWIYRIFSCVLIGFSAALLLEIAKKLKLSTLSCCFLLGLFCFDAKIIDFSINGMETALVVFFLVSSIYSLVVATKSIALLLGLSWSGLMWSRPDSFVYIAAVATAVFLFSPKVAIDKHRRELFRTYLIAASLTTVVYSPWLLWAWSYYGSFIPNTITAKALSFAPKAENRVSVLSDFPLIGWMDPLSYDSVFLPSYASYLGGWPLALHLLGWAAGFCCAFIWLFPKIRPLTRALSCAAFILHLYLNHCMSMIYPWYIPPLTLLSILVLALLAEQFLCTAAADKRIRELFVKTLATSALLLAFCLSVCSAYQLRIQQNLIESNRKEIGLWLAKQANSKDETVFLECLGYIGFFSQLKMLDFPGLSSKEVIAARKHLETDDYSRIIDYLKPDWVVLRPHEVDLIKTRMPGLLSKDYALAKVFDTSEQVSSYRFLPGRRYLEFDQTFSVYKKQNKDLYAKSKNSQTFGMSTAARTSFARRSNSDSNE